MWKVVEWILCYTQAKQFFCLPIKLSLSKSFLTFTLPIDSLPHPTGGKRGSEWLSELPTKTNPQRLHKLKFGEEPIYFSRKIIYFLCKLWPVGDGYFLIS